MRRKKKEENIKLSDDDLNMEDDPLMDDNDFYGGDLNDDFIGDGGTPPISKYNDLMKELTNFNPYLKDCFNNWLGITWDEVEKKYVQNESITPIMNIKCANWLSGVLKTYTRSNNIITDINNEHFNNILMDHIENIWLNLGLRSEEFGILDDGDLIRIGNELEHATALVLMGAGDGKYNQMLQTTITRNETINPYANMNNTPNTIEMKKPSNLGNRFSGLRRFLLGK